MANTNTIIRTNKRENPYVMIDKTGLNDDRLSWKAKGLLAYLLSKPDDWQVYESDLVKRSKDGRDAVRTALRELEKYGYMVRRQLHGQRGQFATMEYVIYEQPIDVGPDDESTVDGKSVDGEMDAPQTGNPSTEKPLTENPLLLSNDCTKNELTKMIDCMSTDSIYDSLVQNVPTYCYSDGMPLSRTYIDDLYVMLTKQYAAQLDVAVVRIACERYYDKTVEVTSDGVTMKLDPANPVGFWKTCYDDALRIWKTTRNRSQC